MTIWIESSLCHIAITATFLLWIQKQVSIGLQRRWRKEQIRVGTRKLKLPSKMDLPFLPSSGQCHTCCQMAELLIYHVTSPLHDAFPPSISSFKASPIGGGVIPCDSMLGTELTCLGNASFPFVIQPVSRESQSLAEKCPTL